MSANLDRFSCGVTPRAPDEVGVCKACSGTIYDYELMKCDTCDAQIHQKCQVECKMCHHVGCMCCMFWDEKYSEWFCDESCKWDFHNQIVRAEKKDNMARSINKLKEAKKLANDNNFVLKQHSQIHYSLNFIQGGKVKWRLNIYPSNQRLYSDPNHRGPFIKVNRPWTLVDVVRAATEKLS